MAADGKVAIDIQDLESQAVYNALLEEKGEIFRTARGRRAILIGNAALLRLKHKLSLSLGEGNDGCAILKG